jgi:Icc-related predicted phosphoesterase
MILDKTNSDKHAGSSILLEHVKRIKPKLHFFGHIHEGKGKDKHKFTEFYNVAK